MSKCRYMPESDKKYMAAARHIQGILGEQDEDEDLYAEDEAGEEEEDYQPSAPPIIRKVMIKTCPYMNVFHRSSTTRLTLDSGAEADLIRRDVAVALGAKIMKTNQLQ